MSRIMMMVVIVYVAFMSCAFLRTWNVSLDHRDYYTGGCTSGSVPVCLALNRSINGYKNARN